MTDTPTAVEPAPHHAKTAAVHLLDTWSHAPAGVWRIVRAVAWTWVVNPEALSEIRESKLRPSQRQKEYGALVPGILIRAALVAVATAIAAAIATVFLAPVWSLLWWPVLLAAGYGAGRIGTRTIGVTRTVADAEEETEAALVDVLTDCIPGLQTRVDADPTALRVGKWQRDDDAQARHSTIILPTGITAKAVRTHLDAIADGLAVWPDQVTVEQAAPGKVRLWVADQRPGDRDVPEWELHGAAEWNMAADPLPIGITTAGAPAALDLHSMVRGRKVAGGSLLVGGATGSGKTTFIRLLVSAAALDPDATIVIFDGKGEGDYAELAPVCDWYSEGLDDLDDLHAMLEQAVSHMNARAKGREAKHPVLIVVDEIQRVKAKATLKLIEDLVRVGRSAGIFIVIATQKPSGESLPTDLRDNVRARLCFRVGNQQTNDMILGTGAYTSGLKATELRGFGSGILIAADGSDVRVRTANVTEEQAARIANTHRREPGQLFPTDTTDAGEGFPTYPADVNDQVQDPPAEDKRIVHDLLGVWDEDADRKSSGQMIGMLLSVDSARYAHLAVDPRDEIAVKAAVSWVTEKLKTAGVAQPNKSMKVNRQSARGAMRADLLQALSQDVEGVSV